MIHAFNHHRRFAQPLTGYRAHWSLYLMAFGLAVILTVVGVSS